ncbi:DUF211 domain-containing protein [Candidatus Bathyarchaeota archaeon]|nr:DUF211 domain-containing protein [Candidatus Bathyarchaeota archaeon]RLG96070.1 MAG: hypothetical protein DRO37_00355 [Candidatus Bathyarchaeota archaeon]
MQHSIKRVVLDVLKLRDPPLPEFASTLCSLPNVEDVKVSLVEIDQNTESVKVTIEGRNIDLDNVQKLMKNHGAVIHSIDEVVVQKESSINP